jgi:hypothetical protein
MCSVKQLDNAPLNLYIEEDFAAAENAGGPAARSLRASTGGRQKHLKDFDGQRDSEREGRKL